MEGAHRKEAEPDNWPPHALRVHQAASAATANPSPFGQMMTFVASSRPSPASAPTRCCIVAAARARLLRPNRAP